MLSPKCTDDEKVKKIIIERLKVVIFNLKQSSVKFEMSMRLHFDRPQRVAVLSVLNF